MHAGAGADSISTRRISGDRRRHVHRHRPCGHHPCLLRGTRRPWAFHLRSRSPSSRHGSRRHSHRRRNHRRHSRPSALRPSLPDGLPSSHSSFPDDLPSHHRPWHQDDHPWRRPCQNPTLPSVRRWSPCRADSSPNWPCPRHDLYSLRPQNSGRIPDPHRPSLLCPVLAWHRRPSSRRKPFGWRWPYASSLHYRRIASRSNPTRPMTPDEPVPRSSRTGWPCARRSCSERSDSRTHAKRTAIAPHARN